MRILFGSVRESDMEIYRRYGLRGVYLGDEAIIRCDRFTHRARTCDLEHARKSPMTG